MRTQPRVRDPVAHERRVRAGHVQLHLADSVKRRVRVDVVERDPELHLSLRAVVFGRLAPGRVAAEMDGRVAHRLGAVMKHDRVSDGLMLDEVVVGQQTGGQELALDRGPVGGGDVDRERLQGGGKRIRARGYAASDARGARRASRARPPNPPAAPDAPAAPAAPMRMARSRASFHRRRPPPAAPDRREPARGPSPANAVSVPRQPLPLTETNGSATWSAGRSAESKGLGRFDVPWW